MTRQALEAVLRKHGVGIAFRSPNEQLFDNMTTTLFEDLLALCPSPCIHERLCPHGCTKYESATGRFPSPSRKGLEKLANGYEFRCQDGSGCGNRWPTALENDLMAWASGQETKTCKACGHELTTGGSNV